MILPVAEGSYYYDDVLTAKAYKKMKDMGIPFASNERLAIIINKLANEIHEIFHENILTHNDDNDDELEMTKVLQKEYDLVFHYLISKYMQTIFKNENI